MTIFNTAVVQSNGKLAKGASDEIVPWWSFTKTLIAACVLRLSEQGRIELDKPLSGVTYTPRDLLQHRAGVGDYGGLAAYQEAVARNDEPWSDDELFAHVPPDQLLFPPRTGWAYSNIGYLLLRRLIETVTGVSLAQVLQTEILEPIDLRKSCLAETRADMALTLFAGGKNYHPGWAYHGIVIGPVAEAALALHRLMTGELLSPASRQAMRDRFEIGGPVPGRPWQSAGYGLGLMMGPMKGEGMAQPIQVAGHSAAGSGSVGAVYHRLDGESPGTAAVFSEGGDEGLVEFEAVRLLALG